MLRWVVFNMSKYLSYLSTYRYTHIKTITLCRQLTDKAELWRCRGWQKWVQAAFLSRFEIVLSLASRGMRLVTLELFVFGSRDETKHWRLTEQNGSANWSNGRYTFMKWEYNMFNMYIYTLCSTFWYHIPISTNSFQQNKKSSNHAPLWGGQHLHLKRLFDFIWNFVSLRWWSLWKKALGDVEIQIWGSNELFNCIPPGSLI